MSKQPDFSLIKKQHKNFRTNFQKALQYAHYEFNASDLKKETIKYLSSIEDTELLSGLTSLSDTKVSVFGKYAYILNRGGDLPDDVLKSFIPTIQKVVKEELDKQNSKKPIVSEIDNVPVLTIQDRLLEKSKTVAAEIEGWIDDMVIKKSDSVKSVDDFVSIFKMYELKAPHMKYLNDIFSAKTTEISLVIAGKDKDLVEAYSNFTKKQLKNIHLFFKNLEIACGMIQDVAKATRAPRKKKPISKEKQVLKLKYKKEDTTLGIVSVNPVNIIGAKEVWVYNCKTRKLAHYKSIDERGLFVKNSSIENYSSDCVEKMIRKPVDTLSEFKKCSKVKLRTFLKDLSTIDTKVNGKINEHHVILRVDK